MAPGWPLRCVGIAAFMAPDLLSSSEAEIVVYYSILLHIMIYDKIL